MTLRALLAACALASVFPAIAATTTTVVDIPAPTGGTQRYLHTRPDAPIATIVQVPGGDGRLGIQPDGSMNTQTANCSPVGRNAEAFASAGIAVVQVDATSTGLVYQYEDILAVVRNVRLRDNVPVWAAGGSASTGTISLLGRDLPGDVGVVLYSPARPSSLTNSIRRPTQVVYHPSDPDQFGNLTFNALTSAVVRERAVITAGSDQGCRFHLFNGAYAEFTAAVTSFITRHNAATRAEGGANYQGLWWRSPAESESGWGLNITHQADTFFVTWFTYDTDGRGLWLVMPNGAKGAGESFSGALYRTTGPAFSAVPFSPSQVVPTEVGTGTLSFSSANDGTFTYTVNGTTQSKAITRQVFGPQPECVAGGSHGASPNYQALWWGGEAESGWGVNLAHQGDTLFGTWFTYDTDGRGMWLVMPNGARTGPGAYSGDLYRTTGSPFNAQWSNAALGITPMGNASFQFVGPEAGTFTYSVGGVTQSKAIVRQVFATPATVCR